MAMAPDLLGAQARLPYRSTAWRAMFRPALEAPRVSRPLIRRTTVWASARGRDRFTTGRLERRQHQQHKRCYTSGQQRLSWQDEWHCGFARPRVPGEAPPAHGFGQAWAAAKPTGLRAH